MARDNEKLGWLDLVLYFGWQVVIEKRLVDEIPHHVRRRTKRFESFFQHLPEDEELLSRCKEASLAISTWFTYLPKSRKKYFNAELLEAVKKFDLYEPEKHKNPATLINEFTTKYNIQLEYEMNPFGKGITLHPVSNKDFMVMAIWWPWFEFAAEKKSRPVYMCEWCGEPFHPARSDAKFHNQNCRSAARRVQIQGESK